MWSKCQGMFSLMSRCWGCAMGPRYYQVKSVSGNELAPLKVYICFETTLLHINCSEANWTYNSYFSKICYQQHFDQTVEIFRPVQKACSVLA